MRCWAPLRPRIYTVLSEALIQDDAQAIVDQTQSLSEHGVDFAHVLEELLGLLHQMAVLHVLPQINSSLFADNEKPRELAKQLSAEQLQLYYQIAILGRRDLPMAPTPRSGFEMTLLRMLAFYPEKIAPISLASKPDTNLPQCDRASIQSEHSARCPYTFSSKTCGPTIKPQTTSADAASTPNQPSASASATPTQSARSTSTHSQTSISSPHSTAPSVGVAINTENWESILPHLNLSGAALAVAQHCTLQKITEHLVSLQVSSGQAPMINERLTARFQESLSHALGRQVRVEFKVGASEQATPAQKQAVIQETRQQHAESAISHDKNVQAILSTFSATIIPDSVEPTE